MGIYIYNEDGKFKDEYSADLQDLNDALSYTADILAKLNIEKGFDRVQLKAYCEKHFEFEEIMKHNIELQHRNKNHPVGK